MTVLDRATKRSSRSKERKGRLEKDEMGRRIETQRYLAQECFVKKKENFELHDGSKGKLIKVFKKYRSRYGRSEGDPQASDSFSTDGTI